MRVAIIYEPSAAGTPYRAVMVAEALERAGHTVVASREGGALPAMGDCDLLYVYRRFDPPALDAVRRLRQRMPVVYDNDDDYLGIPKWHRLHRDRRQLFSATVRMARSASVMTATTGPVAELYRRHGVKRVEVIPNALPANAFRVPRSHDGIVIGWAGTLDHARDARRLGIHDALDEVMARHPEVRVECVGLDLWPDRRDDARYRHHPLVPFERLPDLLSGMDVGLAGLLDIPGNRARSDIKLKEYGACGAAWLASDVGPYRRYGEDQGGRVVAADGWRAAIEELVADAATRERLRVNATAWAEQHTMASTWPRWERLLHELTSRATAVR